MYYTYYELHILCTMYITYYVYVLYISCDMQIISYAYYIHYIICTLHTLYYACYILCIQHTMYILCHSTILKGCPFVRPMFVYRALVYPKNTLIHFRFPCLLYGLIPMYIMKAHSLVIDFLVSVTV